MKLAIITGLDIKQQLGPQLTEMQLNPGDKLLVFSPATPSSQEKDHAAGMIERHLGVPKADIVFASSISAIGVLSKEESDGSQTQHPTAKVA